MVQIVGRPGRILITGATGFVGRVVCARLAAEGMTVRRVLRRGTSESISTDADVLVDEIGPSTNWDRALPGVDAVVHLAARVHVMRDRIADPLSEFRHTNVQGTECLAAAAARAGVRRFVFASSIKAMGERTLERPFVESDEPRPEDPYGLSKLEAERALQKAGATTGMSITILRLPLVYGPGVKGNFLSLLKLCARGVPLPFASIENSRSMLGLDNLAGAISCCLADPRAEWKTYLLSDGEDISTPDLIMRLSQCFGRRSRLFPLPLGVLELGCRAVAHYAAYQRLTGSLQVDSRAIATELGWRPDASLDDGLRKTVDWFMAR